MYREGAHYVWIFKYFQLLCAAPGHSTDSGDVEPQIFTCLQVLQLRIAQVAMTKSDLELTIHQHLCWPSAVKAILGTRPASAARM